MPLAAIEHLPASEHLLVDPKAPPVASLLLKLRRRDEVSPEEQTVVEAMTLTATTLGLKQDLVRDGDRPNHSTLLIDGFAVRYKVLESGGRQITALHVPGDFVDLHSYLLKEMDHGVSTLTRCRIARVPHTTLTRISETHPHLMRLFSLLTLIDGAIHREWLVAMGRKSALAQLANLICEVYLLLETVHLAHDFGFRFPVTQADLADMLGLSSVHVNRTLQELRAGDLITWHGMEVKILNWDRLVETAEFDPTYLHLVKEPR